jgi:PleD family two-component response regulator
MTVEKTEQILEVAQRVCAELKTIEVDEYQMPITACAGLVVHRVEESLEDSIERADQLLALAKREGRDRIKSDIKV